MPCYPHGRLPAGASPFAKSLAGAKRDTHAHTYTHTLILCTFMAVGSCVVFVSSAHSFTQLQRSQDLEGTAWSNPSLAPCTGSGAEEVCGISAMSFMVCLALSFGARSLLYCTPGNSSAVWDARLWGNCRLIITAVTISKQSMQREG